MNHIIEIENLTKHYGKHRGISNLNLRVKEGEIFGFLGSNGAGKSTTIRSMLGLIHVKEGSIKIMGKDHRTYLVDIQKEIGYMPSEAMFYPNMKVSEVIQLAAEIHSKDCREEAENICNRLQVDGKKKIEELSLGNRKKVSIVCAMQHKPKLLILDEPTSGLDPFMQKEFFNLILERNKEGATCFISSHVLSEIRSYCHRAAIIKEGKLLCVDTIDNLSKTNTKRVRMSGLRELPQHPGIKDIMVREDEVEFVYQGEIKELIYLLNELPITNLTLEDPPLEEVFMHFYEQ